MNVSRYSFEPAIGRWPMEQAEIRSEFTIRILREQDLLWRLEGESQRILVGLLAATEHLTVGKIVLHPGRHSDIQIHDGDECLYVIEGSLNMHTPDGDGQCWFELQPGDGFYIPAGSPHQYYNTSGEITILLFGVAPDYEKGAATT